VLDAKLYLVRCTNGKDLHPRRHRAFSSIALLLYYSIAPPAAQPLLPLFRSSIHVRGNFAQPEPASKPQTLAGVAHKV
jgi:hypothetical protein